MPTIYLDNAATTCIDMSVLEAMQPFWQTHYGNPSSVYSLGRQARAAVEKSRKTIAHCLQASSSEIVFTSGGTESNNTVLWGAVRDLGVQRIITSELEHHCILHTVEALSHNYSVQISYARLLPNGHIDLAHLEKLLAEGNLTTLVSLMHGNNEIGNLLDLPTVATLCRRYNALFHTDTVQTFGYYPLNVQDIPIDFLSGSAHKLHGPKGTGFLYIKNGIGIKPYLYGGSQERQMRAGTENVAGIVGLGKAAEIAHETMDTTREHLIFLKKYLVGRLRNTISCVQFNGDSEQGAYKVLNIAFPPSPHNDLLLLNLDIAGICASGGSACSSGADAGSHVLKALAVEPDRTSIRFSFSKYTTQAELDILMEKLLYILKI